MTESENHDIVPVGYVFVFVLEILKQSDIMPCVINKKEINYL